MVCFSMRWSFGLGALAALFAWTGSALAGPLPDASYSASFGSIQKQGASPVDISGAGYSASQTALPDPTVTAQATITDPLHGVQVNAGLVYYFQLNGPNTATPVPVIVDGFVINTLTVFPSSGGSGASAQGEIAISQNSSGATPYIVAPTCSTMPVQNECGTIPISLSFNASVGTAYYVGLIVQVVAEGNATATATVDPSIYVDPSFADANQYSIQVSNGIGNPAPSAVPEPLSMTMLATGLLGLAAARRRKTG